MIELILDAQCTACGECVTICPRDVFDSGPGGVPVLARQQNCQTCFLCELYCETDALFVHPDATATHGLTAGEVATGDYRRDSGWGSWAEDAQYRNEHWRMGDVFALARSRT
ncbi:ferredoxin family protein [Asaia sp. As-1742]|uniref:4Fe-4S dicluster domain-containing protein n=1 Tax=Asaia sp. As-1742 TaxID=2608325 RepID=UPI00142133E2|nr:ferredoxin family protein [Asaia sp. As-1742]NIE80807.1 ferredoxin family protein [Asaia sp. As-1742]